MAIVFLILSIVFSTSINLIFRWFKDYKVDKFQAIIVNYLVCFVVGYLLSSDRDILSHLSSSWFPYCILLGFLFVAIFFSMALTTEKMGISVTAVSGKMSVVVPILFAFIYLNEEVSFLFVFGVILSLLSIYFISVKEELALDRRYFLLPIIVFLGGGIIDTSLKILESEFSDIVAMETISYSIFLGAFLAGLVILFFRTRRGAPAFTTKSVVAGILLGVPNYFSIYFLLIAIVSFKHKSALVFGINNVGVVVLSTLLSILIFRENLNKKNKIGLALAVISISIIAYAN